MKKNITLSPLLGVHVVAGAIVASQVASFADEAELEELDPVSVIATRFLEPVASSTSSVSTFLAEEMERKQQTRLIDVLNNTPGIQGFSTAGQTGNSGSVLVRGLPTNYSQVVIDGVRISDGTSGLNNFLSNAHTSQISQIELLRGPQSVLYGAEAAAGVIGLTSQVGVGDRSVTVFGEAGSFDSYRFSAAVQGELEGTKYALELGNEFTSNDTTSTFSVQDYEQEYAVLSLRSVASEDLEFTFTFRGSNNQLDTQSQSGTNTFFGDIRTDVRLYALNTFYKINPSLKSQLTLGYYDEIGRSQFDGSFGASFFNRDTGRFSVNWSNQWEAHDSLSIVAGAEYADTRFQSADNNANVRFVEYSNVGVYANAYWNPAEQILIEAGARFDEHSTFGGDVAWNIGGAYTFDQTETRVRTRLAQSFRSPTILDSEQFVANSAFGTSTQLANANLETEDVLGVEFGVEQNITDDHQLQVTYFYQEIQNAVFTESISSFPNPTITQRMNRTEKTRVSGVETALMGSVLNHFLDYRFAWTVQLKEELIDVPDQSFNFDVSHDAGNWVVGFGASYFAGASYGNPTNVNFVKTDDHLVSRLYGSYQVNDHCKIHARIENLFNEEYLLSDIFGTRIDGQGFGAYAGLTLTF